MDRSVIASRRARDTACRPQGPVAKTLLIAATLAPAPGLHAEGFILGIGVPGNADPAFHTATVNALSSNGRVAVGSSKVFTNAGEAFRWDASTGTSGLGFLPGEAFLSEALDVSADGSVIVGFNTGVTLDTLRAVRWTPGGIEFLGNLAGPAFFFSTAQGVSDDGRVIVGESGGAGFSEAFAWTEADGMTGLGHLPGTNPATRLSAALAANADGSVVVGHSTSGAGQRLEAFRWTAVSGMTGLGFLPGDSFSTATGVSADGSVVVGYSAQFTEQAFRWTAAGGMVGLGGLGTPPIGLPSSRANDVSADGRVVVGVAFSSAAAADVAFRWEDGSGMQSVADWLAAGGVSLSGWRLDEATGTNADGSIVVGNGLDPDGISPRPWIASANRGLVDPLDFGASLADATAINAMGHRLASLPVHGAHHLPLWQRKPDRHKGPCIWLSGDVARYEAHDADAALVELGGCHAFDRADARLGFAVGKSRSDQHLPFGGAADLGGTYVLAETSLRPGRAPIVVSALALHGRWDADIRRGYDNAGSPDFSLGDTGITANAVQLRGDAPDLFSIGDTALTPSLAYAVTRTRVDAYSETGGGFPARFGRQSHTAHEVRLGATAAWQAGPATDLRARIEGVHRFDRRYRDVEVAVSGLFPVAVRGARVKQTWARLGADLVHRLAPATAVTASIHAATAGADPEISGGISLLTELR